MYRKKSRGWYKHKDFILIDLACLFMALILAGVSDSKRFCQEPVYTGNLSQCDDICHIGGSVPDHFV